MLQKKKNEGVKKVAVCMVNAMYDIPISRNRGTIKRYRYRQHQHQCESLVDH